MKTDAVVMEGGRKLYLGELDVIDMADSDVVVEISHSGISTGTERLFYTGKMPPFPGLGYPLVPGYESIGEVVDAGFATPWQTGEKVFVPGANCFPGAHCLFGSTARRLVVPGDRIHPVPLNNIEQGTCLALAATAAHALTLGPRPNLIVGHGVLGRLLARLAMVSGAEPTVWETKPTRMDGNHPYPLLRPEDDAHRNYRCIIDASGDPEILDTLVARLAPGGVIILAGFYSERLSFAFPPAFMREAQIRVAAEWQREDMERVLALLEADALSLDGLLTHTRPAAEAEQAYDIAFTDPGCLKMALDWRNHA